MLDRDQLLRHKETLLSQLDDAYRSRNKRAVAQVTTELANVRQMLQS